MAHEQYAQIIKEAFAQGDPIIAINSLMEKKIDDPLFYELLGKEIPTTNMSFSQQFLRSAYKFIPPNMLYRFVDSIIKNTENTGILSLAADIALLLTPEEGHKIFEAFVKNNASSSQRIATDYLKRMGEKDEFFESMIKYISEGIPEELYDIYLSAIYKCAIDNVSRIKKLLSLAITDQKGNIRRMLVELGIFSTEMYSKLEKMGDPELLDLLNKLK